MEFFRLPAVRRCREQDNLLVRLLGDAADQVIPLLLAGRRACRPGASVGLVHDHQFGALLNEDITASVRLDEVDADDLKRIEVVNAGVALNLPVEAGLGVRPDDDRFQVEFVANLGLPLLAQVRQAGDGEAFDLAPLQQFFDDQQRFDGLADAHVIGDQQPDRLQPQRHNERDHLIGTRSKRQLGQRTKRSRPVAKGESRGVIQQPGRADVAKIVFGRLVKMRVGRLIGLDAQRPIDACDLVIGTAERFDDQQVRIVRREYDPISPPQFDELSGLQRYSHRTFRNPSRPGDE